MVARSKEEPYRASFWQRLFDLLFGYDYFIAHRSADGKPYALGLYEALTSPGSERLVELMET